MQKLSKFSQFDGFDFFVFSLSFVCFCLGSAQYGFNGELVVLVACKRAQDNAKNDEEVEETKKVYQIVIDQM